MSIHGEYMTRKKIEQLKKDIYDETVKQVGISMAKSAKDITLALAIAILSDTFDFGKIRINRFVENYNILADSLGVGTDTIDQIMEKIKEVYDIDVKQ